MGENQLKVMSFLALVFWIVQTLYFLINWLYWWQVKEYRLDRIVSFLKTSDGIKSVYLVESLFKITLWFITLFLIRSNSSEFFVLDIIDIFSFGVFIFIPFAFIVLISKDVISKRMRKPYMTFRILLIGLVSLTFFAFTIWFIHTTPFLVEGLIFNEILIILSPFIGIILTLPLVIFIKLKRKNKVEQLLDIVKPKVVAITGSFGKTTTKEFVAQILSAKFKIVKTVESENTVLGILNRIVSSIKQSTEIFVAEVGAYKRGEIKEVMKFLHPSIGIITGIEGQHMELFGSLDNVKKAKFELIEGIKEGGTVVFSNNSNDVQELINRAKSERPDLKIITFSDHTDSNVNYEIIKANENGIEFSVFGKIFNAPVYGIHFVQGLVAGAIVAKECGMTLSDVQKTMKYISLPNKTMTVKKVKNSIIIDDSHNSSESGFKAALEYLKLFKDRKKVVLTPGIIELGSESERVHRELGELLRSYVDEILLVKSDFENYMREGLREDSNKLKITRNPQEVIKRYIDEGYVILMEGRMPSDVYKILDSGSSPE